MAKRKWFCYSKNPSILLPVSIAHCWRGFYLPADARKKFHDLELPEGAYEISERLDLANPKTDLDRAQSLLAHGASPSETPGIVRSIPVGPGHGLLFDTDLDFVSWWQEDLLLVTGGPVSKKELSKLGEVQWSDKLVWRTKESKFMLMMSCYHGADPKDKERFPVRLEPGEYVVQGGNYGLGWEDSDPVLILFRFVPMNQPVPRRSRK